LSRAAAKRNEAEARELPALHLVRENEPAVEWADYPRLEPGDYPAYCKRAKWYWEPGFKRWTCILLFDVLRKSSQTSLGTVPMWFNGGAGKPTAARRAARIVCPPPSLSDVWRRFELPIQAVRSPTRLCGRFSNGPRVHQSIRHTVKEGIRESQSNHQLRRPPCQ
jgi:hypothetical protein